MNNPTQSAPKSIMTPKVYPLLEDAIRDSVLLGINRFFKHRNDWISDDIIEGLRQTITDAAIIELGERFHIQDGYGDVK